MSLNVVILAAGRGKRMNSQIPKVLHQVMGRPMLRYAIDAVRPLRPGKTVVVIGNGAELVKKEMAGDDRLSFVIQKQLLGTGNALAVARKELKKGALLVLNGDCPLITAKTLKTLIEKHRRSRNALSFLSFSDGAMKGYGRIFRDEKGRVTGIVEDKHATRDERKKFDELNGGVYLMEEEVLGCLEKVKKNSSSGEYYLTDIVGIAAGEGKRVEAYNCPSEEIRGVNNREELLRVSEIIRHRIINKWMLKGVTFINPETSFVSPPALIGKDTIIYPNTYLEGRTRIGKSCTIYPGSRISDSILGNNVVIKDNTVIEESRVGDRSSIGPFAHLRPHSVIGRCAKIGNFVETKKSVIGEGTKASHLTYLGDAVIGKNVNIGAGTITCNYDGKNKFGTVIESGVFIGSDSQLVAPVKIGKDAYVAAGATITRDVPSGDLAISRARQQNLKGWALKRKLKVKS
ncbi:MAG: UDP-N-acetylglucosamine diphosphorylase/glucosamine-1-phosphate N-acetyltransferase [Nitrospiraceae bacterium]|nr:MAG: UDP-N-acetylglucosamine diphosphorylase/glucosamine-1-phosphate N-acetyltransferase [Nitrospiraceae bacterium]